MGRWTLAALALGTAPAALVAQTPPPGQSPPATPATPAASPAAQAVPEVDSSTGSEEEIVVTGRSPPGAVPGDIKPELQLTPSDIRSYGVSSISDLMTELGPQLTSVRGGEPVILINGKRSAGMSEVANLPPEVLLRVDVLPEEVALKFGYRADQKVINFVLRPRFRSYTGELEASAPTQGGSSVQQVETGVVRIQRENRLNLNLQAQKTSNLLESERDIVPNSTGTQFDLIGNVISPTTGKEIDPALTAAAGALVTVAAVPEGATTLAGFAAGANTPRITDTTPFRTLQSASDRLSASGVYSRTIFGNVSASATAGVTYNRSESLLGLPGVSLELPGNTPFSPFTSDVSVLRYADRDPLVRNADSTSTNAGFALNGSLGKWRWSMNGSYNRTDSDTRTERGVDASAVQAQVKAGTLTPFGDLGTLMRTADRARSVSSGASLDMLVAGTLFALPAGDASTSIRVAGNTSDFSSVSQRSGDNTETRLGRDSGTVRANIDLPISSVSRDVLGAIGNLSLNGNAEVEQRSDFGTLTTIGYGVNWQPITPVRLLVSMSHDQDAPSQQQLGNPVVVTPFVRVFDFVRGETVDVTTVTGGNPALIASSRRALRMGINIKPWSERNFTVQADYSNVRINNPIAGFPSITAEIEAAFPDRFTRDADGVLLRIDNRPVNFERSENSQLRWGVNFFKRITTERSRLADAERQARMEARRAAREAAEANGAPPPGDGPPPPPPEGGRREGRPDGPGGPGGGRGGFGGGPGGGRGGFGGPGGPGGGGGNLQVSVYHTWNLTNTILIRPGLPELDLLDGSATGSGGGTSRHELQFRGGYTRDGLGARMTIDWRSATRVDGGTTAGQALNFGSLATVNLRTFADMGQQPTLVSKYPWLRGSRIGLEVENVFNARQRVTNASGVVPFTYQPGYVDPLGRVVQITLRKLFL
jgi:hypothetical protein